MAAEAVNIMDIIGDMLPEEVRHYAYNPSVLDALKRSGSNNDFTRVRGDVLTKATRSLADGFRYVVMDYGSPDLSQPKEPPITASVVMRSLVMLRCIYEYELRHPQSKTAIKSGLFEGMEVIAPSQSDLCSDKDGYSGMIQDTYNLLELNKIGYPADKACSGSPHIQASAHLLADSALILPRGIGKDYDPSSKRSIRIPYALTPQGRMLSFWMFGDPNYVVGRHLYGYIGIRPVIEPANDAPYSGWFKFIGLNDLE